jgi:hypothetical protein
LEKQREWLLFHAMYLLAIAAAFFAGSSGGDPILAGALFAVVGGAARGGACLWLLSASGTSFGATTRAIGSEALVSALYFVPVALARTVLPTAGTLALALVLVAVRAARAWAQVVESPVPPTKEPPSPSRWPDE